MIKSVNCSGKSKCLDWKIPKKVPWALNFNFSLMIYLNFWEKKCNLGWFREFLFTISSLEWILHSLYQGCVFSKIWRELGFVHYIEYFTISRFTKSSLRCNAILMTRMHAYVGTFPHSDNNYYLTIPKIHYTTIITTKSPHNLPKCNG